MKTEGGDEALRRFPVSQPGADYFLTANVCGVAEVRRSTHAKQVIRTEVGAIVNSDHWRIRGAVIMPDHLHLLATLGPTLPISRAVARPKSRTRNVLLADGLRWQDNYYENRLRDAEDAGKVLLYLFLNPNRAELVPASETYPWFWLGMDECVWFEPALDDGRPFAEWLR